MIANRNDVVVDEDLPRYALTIHISTVSAFQIHNDGPVAVQDDVQVWAAVIVRTVDDLVAGNDFVYQRLAGLWVAQFL